MRPAEVFIVLRDRSIAAVVLAEVASSLGTEMTWLAIPWFVLASTGSPARMGLVFAAEAAPTALLGIPGGAVVQRFGAGSGGTCRVLHRSIFILPAAHPARDRR